MKKKKSPVIKLTTATSIQEMSSTQHEKKGTLCWTDLVAWKAFLAVGAWLDWGLGIAEHTSWPPVKELAS